MKIPQFAENIRTYGTYATCGVMGVMAGLGHAPVESSFLTATVCLTPSLLEGIIKSHSLANKSASQIATSMLIQIRIEEKARKIELAHEKEWVPTEQARGVPPVLVLRPKELSRSEKIKYGAGKLGRYFPTYAGTYGVIAGVGAAVHALTRAPQALISYAACSYIAQGLEHLAR